MPDPDEKTEEEEALIEEFEQREAVELDLGEDPPVKELEIEDSASMRL